MSIPSTHTQLNAKLGAISLGNNDEIKHIAKLFPYSLPIQALLSKNLKESHRLDFDKCLKISAILSPDRNWLYNYINTNQLAEINIAKQTEFKEVNVENKAPSSIISINVPEIVEFSPESISAKNIEIIVDNQIIERPLKPISSIFVDDENIVNEVLESVSENRSSNSEKKEVFKVSKLANEFHDPILEKEILKVAIDKSIQLEVDEFKPETNSEEIVEPIEEKVNPSDFNFWLNPSKSKAQTREEKLKRIDSLIEKFIKAEPKIVAKKVEFYSPVNVAKQSLEFDADLVSETLATVFEKQGYFDQAIQQYEKLSLKFPEKRAYFATRIEKIREIVKNVKNTK